MTEYTVRRYLDLDNARWAKQYAGPIRLIRRTQDEMISLWVISPCIHYCHLSLLLPVSVWISSVRNAADVRTNRGNFLLIKLLSHRYPTIMTSESEQVVTRWLSYTETRKGKKLYSSYLPISLSSLNVWYQSDSCLISDSMLAEYSVVQEECIKRLKELHGKSLDFPLNLGDDIDQSEKSKLVIFLVGSNYDPHFSVCCWCC